MAHHKRRKPRTKVRCTICTPFRFGNAKEGIKAKFRRRKGDDDHNTDA